MRRLSRDCGAESTQVSQSNPIGVAGRTTQGAAWLVGARLVVRGLDFILLLALGRLLGPADFGIVAIAMTLITVMEAVTELPLVQGLISLPEITRPHLDTAFTLGLLRGLMLALLLGLLAWPFAWSYHDLRLVPIICALSLAPATRGLASPAMALYARQISFHRDFILEISGKLASFAVALSLALATRSYWALVAGSLMTPLAGALISYTIAPYRPRLSLSRWRPFWSFIGWNTAAQLVAAVNWQCDRFLISRHLDRATLGRFTMASDLSALPVQALVVPLLRPLTAAFALFRDDRERLATAYLGTTTALLALATPVMVGLSALAGPAVQLVLGDEWVDTATTLRWLALAMLTGCLVTPLGALAMARGRTNVFLAQGSVEFAIKIPAVIAGVLLFGIKGVIIARMAAAVLAALSAMLFARRLCGLSLGRQFVTAWRIVAGGAVSYVALDLLLPWMPLGLGEIALALRLLIAALAGGGVYAVTVLTLWKFSGSPDGVEATVYATVVRLLSPGVRRFGSVAI